MKIHGTEKAILKEVKEIYDEWSTNYDKDAKDWSYTTPKKIAKHLKKYLRSGMKMVDLGCGTGLNGVEYKDLELKLIGADYSAKMLNKAKQNDYHTVQADIARTPFKSNQFDASICTAVLEYFPDIKPYIREMKRIVKPLGVITFTVASTQIEGLHRISKRKLEKMLSDYCIKDLEVFKILSHKEFEIKPIYFWVVIGANYK